MKISGFTYVRNGFTFGYPFQESIKSLLPVVDELIVVVGDSTDGTREAVSSIPDEKIKIVDCIWDENLRKSGKIFAQQSNIGLRHCSGNWAIHLQVDEVLHESSKEKILNFVKEADSSDKIEGLLFPFYHFWGDYQHIRNTRRTHRYEIRAFKNTGKVRSYNDSQGFRKYTSDAAYASGEKGEKLYVLNTKIPIFHYSYSRNPKLMKKKTNYFHKFWHDDSWLQQNTDSIDFDYNDVDKLERFTEEHPCYMKEVINKKDWEFNYDPTKSTMSFKDGILNKIEALTGHRLFEYKNYKLLRLPKA